MKMTFAMVGGRHTKMLNFAQFVRNWQIPQGHQSSQTAKSKT